MDTRTKAIVEILKQPALYPVELVIRALAEIRKISSGGHTLAFAGYDNSVQGGKNAA